MDTKLIKQIDKLADLFRRNGYEIDLIIREHHNILLIRIWLKQGDDIPAKRIEGG